MDRLHFRNKGGIWFKPDDICYDLPLLNGKALTFGDMFNLYVADIGKPHNLIVAYQLVHLVDISAFELGVEINGIAFCDPYKTVFRDYEEDLIWQN